MDLSKLVGLTLRNKTVKNRGKPIKKPLDNIFDISFNPSNKSLRKGKARPFSQKSVQWRDATRNTVLPLQEGTNSSVTSLTGRFRASTIQSETTYCSSSSVSLNHGRCHRHEAVNTNTEVNEGKNFCDVLGEHFCKECTKERRRMDFSHEFNDDILGERLSTTDQNSNSRTVTSYSNSFIGRKPFSKAFSSTAKEVFSRLHNFGSESPEYFINPFQDLDRPSTGNSDSDSTCTRTDTSIDSISTTEIDASLQREESHSTDCEQTSRKAFARSAKVEKRHRVSSAESSDGVFCRRDKTDCRSRQRVAFEVGGSHSMNPSSLSSGETSNRVKKFLGRKTRAASETDATQIRDVSSSDRKARKSASASRKKVLRVSLAVSSDTSVSGRGRRTRGRKPRSAFEPGAREEPPSDNDGTKLDTSIENQAELLKVSTALPSDKSSNSKGRRTRTRKVQAKNVSKGKRTKLKMSEAYNKLPIEPPLVSVEHAKLVMDPRRLVQESAAR